MDGGIFPYALDPTSTSPTNHNEIDTELLTDTAAGQDNQALTNIYANEPANTVGSPVLVPDPSLTAYQTYTMEWFPNEVLWFIDGQLVGSNTIDVPQGSMQFYLDF
jgi:beta-glucanase (GH16 family)